VYQLTKNEFKPPTKGTIMLEIKQTPIHPQASVSDLLKQQIKRMYASKSPVMMTKYTTQKQVA